MRPTPVCSCEVAQDVAPGPQSSNLSKGWDLLRGCPFREGNQVSIQARQNKLAAMRI